MSNDTPAMSAMHQRFQALTTSSGAPHESTNQPWFEPALSEILLRPVPSGSAREGHTAKEHEIGSLFIRLTVLEAWTLHKRLSNPAVGDPLAAAFARLVIERRSRLLAFLGDARRRAALAPQACATR